MKAQLSVSNVSFIYDDTNFGFFETSSNVNQSDAQTECTNWGGNLATIESALEDNLLLYSIPDLDITFECHIGLNQIENVTGTNGSSFVWIDGSNSTYRNFGTLDQGYPVSINSSDCVRHRYRDLSGELSQGWLNVPCSDARNCYFCSKSGKYCSLIITSTFCSLASRHADTFCPHSGL